MRYGRAAAVIALAAIAGQAAGQTEQRVTGPVATYWMSASTTSGMGQMIGRMGEGGPRPGMGGGMMGGGFGRAMDPNAYSHSLILQLGSQQRPQGEPQAEHDPPQALGVGPMLPLVTPAPAGPPTHEEAEPGPPPQYHQPHGRMLIFWGCGEHAGPGQPLVIDFARIGPGGEGAGQLMALSRGLGVAPMEPPSPMRDATYGEWPNAQSSVPVPPEGSLQGDHTIRGDYSPDIHFTLTADQDFLPPIQLRANVKNPDGSASLGWGAVDGARGYFASMIGGSGEGDAVMWASSMRQASAFALPQYLSDREIARLVEQQVLMPANQTSCTVPQEAVEAARHGMFRLIAYGGETNISYPPRPPAPQPWHMLWTVKIRYRAETGGILGMTMPGMGGMGEERRYPPPNGQPGNEDQPPNRPFNPFGGLGGMIP
jgi:hypothetical protein